MYDKILYPTDGSSIAESAIEHAQNQAKQHDATVHVLYVIDSEHIGIGLASNLDFEGGPGMVGAPTEDASGMVGSRPTGREDLEDEGTEIVTTVAKQFEGVKTETAVRFGSPYETILEYVDNAGIDMIVMSTHGRSGMQRYVIGSVTEKIVRFADVPVLTVSAAETSEK